MGRQQRCAQCTLFRTFRRPLTDAWSVPQLYCQNLCLFAKLFIEHKYMFFDVRQIRSPLRGR